MKSDESKLVGLCEVLSLRIGPLPFCQCDAHLAIWLESNVFRILGERARTYEELEAARARITELESDLAEAVFDRDEAADELKYMARKRDEAEEAVEGVRRVVDRWRGITEAVEARERTLLARIRELESMVTYQVIA